MKFDAQKTRQFIRKKHSSILVFVLVTLGAFSLGFLYGSQYPKVLGRQTVHQQLPIRPPDPHPDEPLRKYSIQNLQSYPYQVSEIKLEKVMEKNSSFTSYLFSYRTLGKRMTGQINIPNDHENKAFPIVLMVRGYVDPAEYSTGEGSRYVAAEFAKSGYVTVAPDFLGFGGSDPSGPGWEERFEKPVNVIELIKSLRLHEELKFKDQSFRINSKKLGIWAHSNGGQITLSTLEALGEPIPATLWAPVTAPFPYSVLFYSGEMDDGGRGIRSAVAGFESVYNVQEYSLTQYITRLRGPIQLHQGTADSAVPIKWSDDFVRKIAEENDRRKQKQAELEEKIKAEELANKAKMASASASPLPPTVSISPAVSPTISPTLSPSPTAVASISPIASPFISSSSGTTTGTTATISGTRILADEQPQQVTEISTSIKVEDLFLQPIDINYFVYKGGDHAIRPGWDEAVARDLRFFAEKLGGQ